jgi:hypothetical protein
MSSLESKPLLAERKALERLLAEIPVEEVLERSGLEARLDEISNRLANMPVVGHEPARARLTFRGRPVVGQHGVLAEFGAKVTVAFTDAVAKTAAALSGPLAAMGPIPNRDESRLLITGTAIGSFGFEFEEIASEVLSLEDETIAAQALEMTRNLLQSTLGTDDELADSATASDPRAVAAVRSFVEILANSEATCALEFKDKVFRFSDLSEVHRSVERLGKENLREEPSELIGEFQGVLPKGRTFEFKLARNGEVIRGKVGPGVANADEINQHLHEQVTIDVIETRVGAGRPRYVLAKLPDWEAGGTSG